MIFPYESCENSHDIIKILTNEKFMDELKDPNPEFLKFLTFNIFHIIQIYFDEKKLEKANKNLFYKNVNALIGSKQNDLMIILSTDEKLLNFLLEFPLNFSKQNSITRGRYCKILEQLLLLSDIDYLSHITDGKAFLKNLVENINYLSMFDFLINFITSNAYEIVLFFEKNTFTNILIVEFLKYEKETNESQRILRLLLYLVKSQVNTSVLIQPLLTDSFINTLISVKTRAAFDLLCAIHSQKHENCKHAVEKINNYLIELCDFLKDTQYQFDSNKIGGVYLLLNIINEMYGDGTVENETPAPVDFTPKRKFKLTDSIDLFILRNKPQDPVVSSPIQNPDLENNENDTYSEYKTEEPMNLADFTRKKTSRKEVIENVLKSQNEYEEINKTNDKTSKISNKPPIKEPPSPPHPSITFKFNSTDTMDKKNPSVPRLSISNKTDNLSYDVKTNIHSFFQRRNSDGPGVLKGDPKFKKNGFDVHYALQRRTRKSLVEPIIAPVLDYFNEVNFLHNSDDGINPVIRMNLHQLSSSSDSFNPQNNNIFSPPKRHINDIIYSPESDISPLTKNPETGENLSLLEFASQTPSNPQLDLIFHHSNNNSEEKNLSNSEINASNSSDHFNREMNNNENDTTTEEDHLSLVRLANEAASPDYKPPMNLPILPFQLVRKSQPPNLNLHHINHSPPLGISLSSTFNDSILQSSPVFNNLTPRILPPSLNLLPNQNHLHNSTSIEAIGIYGQRETPKSARVSRPASLFSSCFAIEEDPTEDGSTPREEVDEKSSNAADSDSIMTKINDINENNIISLSENDENENKEEEEIEENIDNTIIDTACFLIDSFFKMPFNSFLHQVVFEIINSLAEYSTLASTIVDQSKLKQKIINAQRNKDNEGLKASFWGHIHKIANVIKNIDNENEESRYNEEANHSKQPEKSEIKKQWDNYLKDIYEQEEKIINSNFGGNFPELSQIFNSQQGEKTTLRPDP